MKTLIYIHNYYRTKSEEYVWKIGMYDLTRPEFNCETITFPSISIGCLSSRDRRDLNLKIKDMLNALDPSLNPCHIIRSGENDA